MKTVLKAFAITIFLTSVASATTPSITAVTGSTIAPKANLFWQITNFEAKSPAGPVAHADFLTDFNPSTPSQNSVWSANDNLFRTSSCQGLLGAPFCAKGVWTSTSSPIMQSFSFRVDHSWHKVYHYQLRYYSDSPTANLKFWRLFPNSGGNDYVAAYNDGGGISLNEADPGLGGGYQGGAFGEYQGSVYNAATWLQEEFIWKYSGGTGLNPNGSAGPGGTGVWRYRRNLSLEQTHDNTNNITDNLIQLRTDNFTDSAHLPANGTYVILGREYMDDTAIALFISTSPTWAAAIDRRPQPMILATSTAAVTYTDLGGIDTSKQPYGYAMNSLEEVNSNGFAITLAAGISGSNLAPFIVPFVNVSSFSVNWSSAGASYVAVVSTNSDFSFPISSGTLTKRTTNYSSLPQYTTFYFEVKNATGSDSEYSGAISTVTLGTNLGAAVGSPTTGSLTATWNTSITITRTWSLNSDFSGTPISTGSTTSPDVQSGLGCGQVVWFQVKVATETSYNGNILFGTTSSCAPVSNSIKARLNNIKIKNAKFK